MRSKKSIKNTLKAIILIALTSALWAYVMHRELKRVESDCAKNIREIYMVEKPY